MAFVVQTAKKGLVGIRPNGACFSQTIARTAELKWTVNDMASKKTLKVVDYEAVRAAFDEKFKETRQLIESGETHLDNLAEGFHEADEVIWSMPTIDAVPVEMEEAKENE